jgi:isopropylmalate/homocitrate/citramalate synthase
MGHPGIDVVLGKGSGTPSVAIWLENLGLDATPEQELELLMMVKEKSIEKKGLLTEEEFRTMTREVLGQG